MLWSILKKSLARKDQELIESLDELNLREQALSAAGMSK